MHLNLADERILAVVAHPDDAELLCAGTLARAVSQQSPVAICVLCQGDKGQPDPPIEQLGDVRSVEMKSAAEVLGAELFEVGIGDGELCDDRDTRLQLVEILRRFRPTLVLAHAETDYHPDHQAASALTAAATWFCASAGHHTDSSPLAAPPGLWWMDTIEGIDFRPHHYIDVSEHVELKRAMLNCHQSQIARGDHASFSPLEPLMLRQLAMRGAQCGVEAAEAFQTAAMWKRIRAW